MLNRRSLLFGLGASLFIAPAIVKASNLMPINSLLVPRQRRFMLDMDEINRTSFYQDTIYKDKKVSWIDDSLQEAYQKDGEKPNYYEMVNNHWKESRYSLEPKVWFHQEYMPTNVDWRELAWNVE